MRRRAALYLALALLVPASAFALDGEGTTGGAGGPSGVGQLGVSASLDSCGIYENSVVCKIDASFDTVDGASSYTASVTRPDGSVIDYGEIGGAGGASFWVPYAGDGTYTVQISAYGQLDADPQLDRVARDRSAAGPERSHDSADPAGSGSPAAHRGQGVSDTAIAPDGPGAAGGDGGGRPTTPPDDTSCDEQGKPLGDPPTDQANAAALARDGQLPESVDCPPTDPPPADPGDGSGDPSGDPGTGDPGITPPPGGTTTTPADPPPSG